MEDALFILLILTGSMFAVFRIIFVRQKGLNLFREPPEVVELHGKLSEKVRALPQQKLKMRSSDGLMLHARYFPANPPTDRTVVLSHGYRGEGLHDHAHNVLYYLSHGRNVLLPDHRSHGDSEGKYIGFGTLESQDLIKWCRLIVERFGTKKILFHGISMGAATVILASRTGLPELCGTVSDCSYTSGREIFAYVTKNILKIPASFMLDPVIYTSKLISRADIARDTPIEAIKNATVPFLFIHGADDDFVPTEMSKKLYEACNTKKRLLLFEGARHAEAVQKAPKRYYSEIERFIKEIGM